MIFNQNLIFIHIGKTGGMSCARYLLEHLHLPVYNCHKQAENELRRYPELKHAIPLQGIGRHCTLIEALEFIQDFNGKTLFDFKKVIAVIRHPYTLEYSYYRHMQKPGVLQNNRTFPNQQKLATLDFQSFVAKADHHRFGHPQEKFFLVDGKIPKTVELIRFEELSAAFIPAVAPYVKEEEIPPFPEANRTQYLSNLEEHLSPEVRELIYQKHKYMFDSGLYYKKYYDR
jgi:hypothetical protein